MENKKEVNWSLYTKDKSANINNIVHKIEFDLKTKKENLTIEYLQRQCFSIEELILDGINYAKTKDLKEKSIRALIWNIKKALEVQKKIESILIELGTTRDIGNEEEMFAAFDFNLDGEQDDPFLSNAFELEERIKKETGFRNEKNNSHKRKLFSKAGRKKTEIKDAKEYLKKFVNEEHKMKFIQELKNQYQKRDHLTFNYLIKVLIDLGYLQVTKRIALKTSFEKALDREKQSQQNFNKQYAQDSKNTVEYKNIMISIRTIFETSLT